jgi:hypothetical protein
MANQNSRNTTVILSNQLEYTKWKIQLAARCDAYNIWSKVNPESTLEFIPQPQPPVAPDVAHYAPRRANLVPDSIANLSEAGATALKQDMEYFKIRNEDFKNQERRYQEEQRALREITIFIQSTVAPHLQETCCRPGQNPRQWIANLTETVGVDERIEKERAREKYNEARKPMKNAANWEPWLIEYDQAATQAEANGVDELKDINSVTKDFIVAVWDIAPTWAGPFQDNGRFTAGITRREMIKRFRDHMMMAKPPKPVRHRSAFVVSEEATYYADNDPDMSGHEKITSHSSSTSRPLKRKRPREQQSRKDTTRSSTDLEPSGKVRSSKCPACEMRHSLKECFYVNPDKAPEWFRPKPMVENYIRMMREHDPEFQGLLRGQSKPRSKPSVMNKSHTPTTEVRDD